MTAENEATGELLSTNYKLNIKSPCFDANLVTFPSFVEMPAYALYYLYEALPLGITIVSDSLLRTEPPLCMNGLEYLVTYDNELVTEDSVPLSLV